MRARHIPEGNAIKSNILTFKKDAGFYYKLSQRAIDRGDFADAVYYLKRAAGADSKDDSYSLELARTLSLVNQYEQSNLIYLKLIAGGNCEGKCYFGLSQNLYYLNDIEHSVYFLNLYMDKYSEDEDDYYGEDDEYFDIVEEDEDYEGYEIVYPIEKQDMGDLINKARSLMKEGMFEKAAELLKKVPKGNIDYLFARNNMALCCFFLNDYGNTKLYSGEVLSDDPDNIFALCNLAAMYNYVGDSINSAIYLKRFLAINTDDISDLFKIATTLCELKEHALALKYLKLILKQKPYDTNILFLTAIASYNNKLINEAVDIFITLLKLNEKDYAAKYYLKLIRQAAKEKDIEKGFFQPLEYICQVPYGEMLERIKKLRDILLNKNAFKKETGREEILELCDWSFSVSDLKFQKLIIGRLMSLKDEKVQEFLKEKLLDPKISLYAKRFIIEKFMLAGKQPGYRVSIEYTVKKIEPHVFKPAREEKAFYAAYALAYSTLTVFLADSIENDLFNAYKDTVNAAKERGWPEFTNKKALAALIAFKSKNVKQAKIRRSMCKLFRAEYAAVEKYEKALGF